MMQKKIAFILFNYPLGVSTMLINAIDMLRTDHTVKIYTNTDQSVSMPFDPWLTGLVEPLIVSDVPRWYEKSRLFSKWSGLKNKAARFFSLKESWESKNSKLFKFSKILGQRIEKDEYDMVIAVEAFSLIAADRACRKRPGLKMIYFDMELLDWSDENPLYTDKSELKKRQHQILTGRVDHVVITSFNRADIFSRINDFPRERISVLPVVPRKRNVVERSDHFRKKFNIGSDKYIVVYSGNFMPWAQCLEIIKSMADWPDNAVLVMHTWNKGALSSSYFEKMQEAAQGYPVYFSADYLMYNEMASALTSADAGLLFYESIDDNFTEICFSSNKMGEYLASGLPVVCSPFPSLREFVENNNIGAAVPFNLVGKAINEIFQRKEYYDQQVKICCEKYFVFENYFNSIIADIENIKKTTE